MNIVKSATLLLLVIWPHASYAAFKTYENTWFEIEVILFKQLGDKTQLQEVFPETSTLPQRDSIIDILRPYITPSLTKLKAALPQCDHFPQFTHGSSVPEQKVLSKDQNINQRLNNIESTLIEEPIKEKFNINHTFINMNGPKLLTTYETQVPSSNTFSSPETSCEVSQFKVPEVVVGTEDLTTEVPYIINNESLKLHDIMKRLQSSRSFKPLLHMGWRQITRMKSEAVPIKISAGDNLITNYLTELANYNAALEKQTLEQLVEDNSNTVIGNDQLNGLGNKVSTLLNEKAPLNPDVNANINDSIELGTVINNEEDIASKLAAIIQEAQTQTHHLDNVLAELNGADSDSQYISSPLSINNEKQLIAPQYPPQEWSINGFLKVDVERFLHVTAEFNVINMSIAEQTRQQQTNSTPIPLQSIHFKQNKRVRSNEIHYFDHPYMGMIVQIRRHEQTQPELEPMEDVIDTKRPITTDNKATNTLNNTSARTQ